MQQELKAGWSEQEVKPQEARLFANWTQDDSLSSRINHQVAHYTGQTELANAKEKIDGLPEAERQQRTMTLEGEFRAKLDALYGKVSSEFEAPVAKA